MSELKDGSKNEPSFSIIRQIYIGFWGIRYLRFE